jgi:hypothetical protein
MLQRDALPLELLDRRRERRLAWVARNARDRKRRGLDHDRDPAVARNEYLQRRARKWEAQRLTYGGTDVRERLGGRRSSENDCVVGRLDHVQPGAGEERDSQSSRA